MVAGGAEGGQRQNARAATAEAARCAAAPAAWRSSPLSAALVLGEPLELVEVVPRFDVLKCLKVRRHDRRPGNSDICVPIGRAVASANCEARKQEACVVSSIKISARVARAIVCRSTVRRPCCGAHSATKKASITGFPLQIVHRHSGGSSPISGNAVPVSSCFDHTTT